MLLIRPWLRMNRLRVTAHHVVFFIFIVSNVGGCLTPIGDPPLFLGYLRGVPFWWITLHALPMWATATGMLLAMFYWVDRRSYRHLPAALRERVLEPADEWSFRGRRNLIFLAAIVGAVFIDSPPFLREAILVAAAAGSYLTTPRAVYEANCFSFHPIREVAILFAGIFATMMPALDWLHAHAAQFGAPTPALFYWATGLLSSVLDNAPTYLSFLSAQMGSLAATGEGSAGSAAALVTRPDQARILVAISVGAVFFGANTYIGNGPNFMVKAIADQQLVATPGFIGYVWRYTLPFMLPTLVVVWWLFFRS
jgi:Na+/H+ antiporter NhaD/arsenite permease-like protein